MKQMLLNKFPGELQLPIYLSYETLTQVEKQKIIELIHNTSDWNTFLGHVKKHRLAPAIYHTVTKHFKREFPESTLQALKIQYLGNIKRCLRNQAELIKIVKLFNKHHIEFLILKGIPLAIMLYGNPCLRHAGDIDIIVSPDQFDVAGVLLKKNGFFCKENRKQMPDSVFQKKKNTTHHLIIALQTKQ